MDPIFHVMCDVAGLVSHGSDVARMEARRMAAERERRAAAHDTVVMKQSVAAATPRTDRNPALLYKWLKVAFRSL